MNKSQDPYEILGVSRDATQTDIKKAFRKQSMLHHPDRHGGNGGGDAMKRINTAYDKIKDPEKRRLFDMGISIDDDGGVGGMHVGPEDILRFMAGPLFGGMSGISGMPGMPGAGMPGGGMPGAGMPGAGMPGAGMPGAGMAGMGPDISAMFGGMPEGVHVFHMGLGGMPPPGMMGGAPHMSNMSSHSVSSRSNHPAFSQSSMPKDTHVEEINLNNMQEAIEKPSPIIKKIQITLQQAYTGCKIPLEIEREIIDRNQHHKESETLYVNIPTGIDENEIILLEEKGNIKQNIRGDIKVFIKIKNRTNFIREGLDLVFVKTITLKEALCGFSFKLTHIDGKEFQLNNGSGNIIEPGYKKILATFGMQRDGISGNLIIEFKITFPANLTNTQINKIKDVL